MGIKDTLWSMLPLPLRWTHVRRSSRPCCRTNRRRGRINYSSSAMRSRYDPRSWCWSIWPKRIHLYPILHVHIVNMTNGLKLRMKRFVLQVEVEIKLLMIPVGFNIHMITCKWKVWLDSNVHMWKTIAAHTTRDNTWERMGIDFPTNVFQKLFCMLSTVRIEPQVNSFDYPPYHSYLDLYTTTRQREIVLILDISIFTICYVVGDCVKYERRWVVLHVTIKRTVFPHWFNGRRDCTHTMITLR